jgi:hypothetical protein
LELQREVVGVGRGVQRGLDRDLLVLDELEALVERSHAVTTPGSEYAKSTSPEASNRSICSGGMMALPIASISSWDRGSRSSGSSAPD